MKRVFILLIILLGLANSTTIIKRGWQLVGLDRDISDMSIFDDKNISVIWTYDSSLGKWSGYTPDKDRLDKIAKDYSVISKIDRWQGIWINSKSEWQLELEDDVKSDTRIDIISLKKGWNLISIPIQSTLSPKIFKDALVWKYSDNNWSIFENNSTTFFDKIDDIKSSDGIWVKVKEDRDIDISKESASLGTFDSYDEMLSYIRDMRVDNLYYIYDDILPVMEADKAEDLTTANDDTSNTTNTNLQESGVDESDIIKNDGNRVYYLDKNRNKIYIRLISQLAQNSPYITAQIELENSANSFYLYNNSVVVLSDKYDEKSQVVVDIYDINTLLIKGSFIIDGNLASSRILENRVILVTNFTPNNDENISIPQIQSPNYSGDLISYRNFYAPYKKNQESTITTISAFNLDNIEFEDSSSIVGYSDTIYASTNAIYIVSSKYPIYYNFNDYQARSVIYKFNIKDNLNFEAEGFVNGTLLNQFSLSEYNSTLRIATTEGFSWSDSGTKNSIFTLEQNGTSLENIGYLGSLGKDGESIKSVRFMGKRAFVVTFLQTDPLYTIDLSNSANPRKVGELQIDGFSSYLHIIDDNRVLAVGQDADENGRVTGLMLELFDISDFANPTLASKINIGNSSYYSEALNNHKAFIYRDSDKLFGIPYKNYEDYRSNYFGLYQIKGNTIMPNQVVYNYQETCYNTRGVIFDYENRSYITSFCGESSITQEVSINE